LNKKWLFGLLAVVGVLHPLAAQDLSFNVGSLSNDSQNYTYGWQLDFRYHLPHLLAWSASWINEGHLTQQHQDGFATQLWEGLPVFRKKIALSFGVGIDRYFVTEPTDSNDSVNLHGWAAIYSILVTYQGNSQWFYRLIYNRIDPSDTSLKTNSLMLGVGYKLWRNHKTEGDSYEFSVNDDNRKTTGYELTGFTGRTAVNTFHNNSSIASGLEFRKGIARYADWTLSWIEEGNMIQRHGLATQVWIVDVFLNNRLSMGIGFGGYDNFEGNDNSNGGQSAKTNLSGLITQSISYRFSTRWCARFNWNRVTSNYNRDSDIFLLGLGYRWENQP
jgi:hypothetical protein